MFNNKRGFTLIELLVVIAIIALISSVIFASLKKARIKSRDARRVADIKQIQLGLELYFNSNRSYPTGLYGAGATTGLTAGNYMPTVSYDPLLVTEQYDYAYDPAALPLYYHLGASLEESTNPALASDKDCNSTVAASCPGANIYQTGFNGAGAGTTGCRADMAASRYCYDVVP